jgi:hypothetical protein
MNVAKWIVITGLAVVVVLIAGITVLGAMVASDDPSVVQHPGRLTQMEQSGQMHEMMQKHQDMIDRMRSDVSPQMQRVMDKDPMTQMMRSGEMIRMQEQHQSEIDRMLGRMPEE